MSHPIVELQDVHKEYKQGKLEVKAVNGIDLTIEPGEFTAICGPSGSGKTTLLNLIGCLDTPTRGSVHVDGKDVSRLSDSALADLRLRKIGFVFQAYNLVPVLTAFENVELVLALQGVPAAERKKRVLDILDEVGLSELRHRRPMDMSGGQQQRVAVARAVVANPKLVLADEPTANLDSHTGAALLQMMADLNREHQVTFLFSTHDPMVMDYSRRIVRIVDGKISSDDTKAHGAGDRVPAEVEA
ncbi:ABC transporter ATP-binding protein [Myxococcota bacterium]|nr:ABC transporter ATP-binding protein [Myxococcota bacterium]MBU1411713.1 ABC transporter ATP-binding protein [Myxococcota bacterium]MBU1512114.1 ABC transporter ATP-binding protein [Myxococcota bacterium]